MKQKIWKVAICEDNFMQQQNMSRMVNYWCESRGYTAQVTTFSNGESLLFAWSEHMDFDLMLLDIDLGKDNMNGMELAEFIRKKDEHVILIFTTALTEYMNRGYDIQALHFLIKPVEQERLFEVLDRANAKINKKEETLLLESETELSVVTIGRILYAEAFSHSISLMMAEGNKTIKQEFRTAMKELEKRLEGHGFFRCHRSYLVSLRHIRRINESEIFLENDLVIPVGRTRKQQLFQAFIAYHKANGGIR